jgi:hypothetical protein
MLFWPLPLGASLLYCSILDPDFVLEFCAVQIFQHSQKLSLKLFHISSTQLPLFAHVGSFFQRKFCSPIMSVLWYAGTDRFCCVTTPLPIHSTSNNTPQWSLILAFKAFTNSTVIEYTSHTCDYKVDT